MRRRSMYIGGIVALCVIAAVLVLSGVGFRQCGRWMVSTAVGFFTQQDVSPEGGGWGGPEYAQAEEVPNKDAELEPRSKPEKGEWKIQLAAVENKNEAAETGFRVISGEAGSIMDEASPPEEQPRADDVTVDAQDAPEQVRETERGIVNALEELTGKFTESDSGDEDAAPDSPDQPLKKTGHPAERSDSRAAPTVRQSDDPLRPKFSYSGHGRRDPFRALISNEDEETRSDKLDLDEARLVGILWGGKNNVALLEDFQKVAFCLKEGDRVQDGRLVTIRSNSVVFSRFRFGRTETVVLELEKKKAGGS